MPPPSTSKSSGSPSVSTERSQPAPMKLSPEDVLEEMQAYLMDAVSHKKPDKRHVAKLVERILRTENYLEEFVTFVITGLMRAMILPLPKDKEMHNILSSTVELIGRMADENPNAKDDSDHEDTVSWMFNSMLFPWLTSEGVHNSKETSVRYAVMITIGLLLDRLPGKTMMLKSSVFDKVKSTLLLRLQDESPDVRWAAVQALLHGQNSRNLNCPGSPAYAFHNECNPSCTVGLSVVQAMEREFVASGWACEALVDRIIDEHPCVRREALKVIGEGRPFNDIETGVREALLQYGLTDESEIVYKAAKKYLVFKWIDECDGVMNVLSELDLLHETEVASLFLQAYFEDASAANIGDNLIGIIDVGTKLIPLEKLTVQNAFYWAELMKYLRIHVTTQEIAVGGAEEKKPKPLKETVPMSATESKDNEEGAGSKGEAAENSMHIFSRIKALPPDFALYFDEYTKYFVTEETEETLALIPEHGLYDWVSWKTFIQLQLINSCEHLGYSDDAGRLSIGNSLKRLLVSVERTPRSLLKPICEMIAFVYPDDEERLEAMLDVVAHVRFPLEHHEREGTESVQEDTASRPSPRRRTRRSALRPPVVSEEVARERAVERKQYQLRIEEAQAALADCDMMDYEHLPDLSTELDRCRGELWEYERRIRVEDVRAAAYEDGDKDDELAAARRNIAPTRPSDERTDPPALIRALGVIKEIFFTLHMKEDPDLVYWLQETFVAQCMQNADPVVKNEAVIVLGLCCLRSLDLAKLHLGLLLENTQGDVDFIVESAFGAVFNILRRWGCSLWAPEKGEPVTVKRSLLEGVAGHASKSRVKHMSSSNVLEFLLNVLKQGKSNTRAVCVKGLTKLALDPLWRIDWVLSELLLTFFSPGLRDLDEEVHQLLSTFFAVISLDVDSWHAPRTVKKAFFTTMTALFDASDASDATVYSPNVVIKWWEDCCGFMLDIIRTMDQRSDDPEMKHGQTSLAVEILGQMSLQKNFVEARGLFYSKVLLQLELPLEGYVIVRYLADQAKIIKKKPCWGVRRAVAKELKKFIEKCEEILSKAPEDVLLRLREGSPALEQSARKRSPEGMGSSDNEASEARAPANGSVERPTRSERKKMKKNEPKPSTSQSASLSSIPGQGRSATSAAATIPVSPRTSRETRSTPKEEFPAPSCRYSASVAAFGRMTRASSEPLNTSSTDDLVHPSPSSKRSTRSD